MESLFEKMLVEQYGIHPHSSEFMLRVLEKVFHEDGNDRAGETQVRMTKSFHIKLAPTDTTGDQSDSDHVGGKERSHGSMEEEDGVASTSTGTDSTSSTADTNSKTQKQIDTPVTTLRSRLWQDRKVKENRSTNKKQNDEDKKNGLKKEEKDGRYFRFKNTQAGVVKTTATMSVSLLKKSQLQDTVLSTPVRVPWTAIPMVRVRRHEERLGPVVELHGVWAVVPKGDRR
jgi:hypothetical protein